MNHLFPLIVSIFLSLPLVVVAASFPSQEAPRSCRVCHDDPKAMLPAGHEVVAEDTIEACLPCHRVDRSSLVEAAPFAARLHQAHLGPQGEVDCLLCHSWNDGRAFGIVGESASWGSPTIEEFQLLKEILVSWAGSDFLDRRHGRAMVSCGAYHGPSLPGFDATVSNAVCLSCHGPMEQLAKKTEPPDFKDRNPHRSHLGEIDCTVCHKAHGPSKVYCLGCHQKFPMTIPGAGDAQGKSR